MRRTVIESRRIAAPLSMTRPRLPAFVVGLALLVACGGSPSSPSPGPATNGRLTLAFTPESPPFSEATDEYRRIWAEEGARIEDVAESATGLSFPQSRIDVVVFEGVSVAGGLNSPMMLRASNTYDRKKGTLVHELGHRLVNPQLTVLPEGVDEHRLLDLFLYDVWESLWGRQFADERVQGESEQRGLYDYESAWRWALGFSRAERASRFAEIVRANRANRSQPR